nr:MAG TPA: hypothetical protein [Caudoviricetes sp.]
MPLQYSYSIRSTIHSVFRTLFNRRHETSYADIFRASFADPAAACGAHINMNKAARKHSTAIISNTTTLGKVGQGRYIQCNPNRVNTFDPDISGSTKAMLATRASTDGDVIGRSTIPRVDVDRSAKVSADLFQHLNQLTIDQNCITLIRAGELIDRKMSRHLFVLVLLHRVCNNTHFITPSILFELVLDFIVLDVHLFDSGLNHGLNGRSNLHTQTLQSLHNVFLLVGLFDSAGCAQLLCGTNSNLYQLVHTDLLQIGDTIDHKCSASACNNQADDNRNQFIDNIHHNKPPK